MMFPWMKEQLTEAWNSRRSSKSSKKSSANNSDDPLPSTSLAESFTISVIGIEGKVMYVPVSTDFTFEQVKTLAIEHFYGHDKQHPAKNYRLVHATQLKPLLDEKKLSEELISDSDELMLVKTRSPPEKDTLADDVIRGPSMEQILSATADLPVKNPPKPVMAADFPFDFQAETRRILVTLVQASAKILMHSPEAVQFYAIIKEKLEVQLKPPNDPKAVKFLVDMGFSERKALRALQLRKMNTSEALEWLVEHEDDPEDTEELQLPLLESILEEAGPSSSSQEENRKPNLVKIVNLLLDSYIHYLKLDFKPDPHLVESFEEMGFEKKQILETLKITGNHSTNACAWLVGERHYSLDNLYEGIDPKSPIYEAIMSNPQIQLSLTNPKMLLAYLSMLETPSSTTIWMKDPQVSPVINQIFKTFHAEKHAIHVNRYSNS
ncbi:hypothetical protein TKK_0004816 [Trichogramma kaykai]